MVQTGSRRGSKELYNGPYCPRWWKQHETTHMIFIAWNSYSLSYCIVLYSIVYCIVLYSIVLYCIVSYRIVLYLFLIDEIIQWGNYEEICKGQLRSSGRTLLVRKLVCRPERSFCSSIVVCQRQVLWLPSALELYISSLQGDHLVLFIFISF